MCISFMVQAGSIVVTNQWWSNHGLESINFANGTVWNQTDFAARYMTAQTTAGNDTIWGTDYADLAQGGAGADAIFSGAGNDILIGGIGNDRLEGGVGADNYSYSIGDGDDIILDQESDGIIDTLSFGTSIAPSDIQFNRGPGFADVRMSFVGQAGSIVSQSWWNIMGWRINSLTGQYGARLSCVRYLAAQTTSGNDTIWGTDMPIWRKERWAILFYPLGAMTD